MIANKIISEDMDYIINQEMPWDKLYNKSVLITGANGFLPSYIVKTLVYLNERKNANINIICLVRNRDKAYSKFKDYIEHKKITLLIQDVCEPVKDDCQTNYIIHAASKASPKYYGKDPVGVITSNIIGTYLLLEYAKRNLIDGFLFISSGEVYGRVNEKQIPTREEEYGYIDPMNVRSCYGEGKRAAETLCISYFYQYEIPVKIVRPFHTYGPGMELDDRRVYADFVANIVNNEDIVMTSDGSSTRAFCYLSDAIVGFFTVLLNGLNGQAYNIGSDIEISILNLAEKLIKLFPEKKLLVIKKENEKTSEYITSQINRACPDISKVKELGWRPNITIEEGFKRTIESYSEITIGIS